VANSSKSLTPVEIEPKPKVGDFTLSAFESRSLLGICIEFDLCSKASGKIDPAVGYLVAHAWGGVLTEVFDVRP
jgi:hypothetical protein